MTYVLSPRARRDLDGIWEFSVATWGEERAETYFRRLADAFTGLAAGTVPGRSAEDVRAGYWKLRVGSHIVFYRMPSPDRIEVVRVLHQSMDVDRHL